VLSVVTNNYLSLENERALLLSRLPVSITCAIFDDVLLVDPSLKEEEVARGSVTCVVDEKNNVCVLDQVTVSYY
jgi:exosome complex RNA-binding protein Rrp42 (RNase PH superfamily)